MTEVDYLRFSKERREAYNDYLNTLAIVRRAERRMGRHAHAIYDSPLSTGEEDSFSDDFRPVVPGRHTLRSFVLEEFGSRRGELVGFELGGPGSRCFADFPKGFFRLTAGVTLVDLRGRDEKTQDRQRHHNVVAFDVSNPLLGQKLKNKLGISKAHFIIERMEGGLPDDIRDPYFLYQVGNNWYQLLETGGVMFIQCPRFIHKILPAWESKVNSAASGTLEACYYRQGNEKGVLRISKKDGAPESLPFLTPRELRDAFTQRLCVTGG